MESSMEGLLKRSIESSIKLSMEYLLEGSMEGSMKRRWKVRWNATRCQYTRPYTRLESSRRGGHLPARIYLSNRHAVINADIEPSDGD